MKAISKWGEYKDYLDALKTINTNKFLFHQDQWLKIIKQSFNLEIKPIFTFNHHGKLLALTPVMIKKRGPFCLMGSPLRGTFTDHSGIIFKENISEDIQSIVLKSQFKMLKKEAHYIELGFSDGYDCLKKTLSSLNFKETAFKSSLISLPSKSDELMSSFTGRARNMIRKSEKKGVSVLEISPNKDWINKYYMMLNDTFSKQGQKSPHPKSFFLNLINLHENKNALFLGAYLEKEIVAAAIYLVDKNRMIYLSGTSNKKGLDSAATSALKWHAMQYGQRNNYEVFDMGGLGIPSIDKFKLSFGGEIYTKNRWIYQSKALSLIEPFAMWAINKGIIRFKL